MSLFDDMLKDNESLFLNPEVLDYDYLPKMLPYREQEQKQIARAIQPLFSRRNGKNVLVYGQPGIGKTVAIRHVLRELEEKTDDIIPLYINTWQKNTTYKIIVEICDQLNYKFTHNKKTEDLFKILRERLNKDSVVFAFDEIDKVEDLDFLYMILEQIYRKTIILITNYPDWISDLDMRIKSRLTLEHLEFGPYDAREIRGILQERIKYAFVDGIWEKDALEFAVKKTADIGDVRTGLYMLREAGNAAEEEASRSIKKKHAEMALEKVSGLKIKNTEELKEDEQVILDLVRKHSGKKIGDLYKIYKEEGGEGVYKTFQRKINFLSKNKFISTQKQLGGEGGTTTIVKYERETKLDEY